MLVHKNITIKKEHEDWIAEKSINLSKFVRSAIDSEIKVNGE